MDLTFNQRKAISQMISALSNRGWQKMETLKFFSDYRLPVNCSELPAYTYYQLLRELPLSVKRDILQRIIKASISLHNYDNFALYDAFKLLIYLKICSGVEFFVMNALCSFLDYFEEEELHCDSVIDNQYKLTSRKTGTGILINIHENRVHILISGTLINEKLPFDEEPSQKQIQILIDSIKELPLKRTMPWIYANSNINWDYQYFDSGKGVVKIYLSNIEYIDSNGG